MPSRNSVRHWTIVPVVLSVSAACTQTPMQPTPGQPAGPSTNQTTTFTIVDGWSHVPVAGAAVTVNGTQAVTDAVGQARFPGTLTGCVVIDVRAEGYLDRRTCTTTAGQQITLWPIANAAEAEVTRQWIFFSDRIERGRWSDPIQVDLGPELAARDVAQTWRGAAETITSVSGGRIRFEWIAYEPAEGVVLEQAATPPSCSATWRPPWPYEVAGFCVKYDPRSAFYFLDRLQIAPERLGDAQTALHALLSEAGINSQTLPGLMNATRPDVGFSEFERKTLGMLGLRLRTVTWPDYDQIQ